MWRSATRSVAEGGGTVLALALEDLSPLSAAHKRLVRQVYQEDVATTASEQPGSQQLQQLQQLWLANINQGVAAQESLPSAVQQAYAEWSRQVDVPSRALAHDQLPVTPLDLGPGFDQPLGGTPVNTQITSFWEQQDHQLLQILFQDDQGAAAAPVQQVPACVPTTTPTPRAAAVDRGSAQDVQGLQPLWDAAVSAPKTSAEAARECMDALFLAGAVSTAQVERPIPLLHTSPFLLSAPAAVPAAPAQVGAAGHPGNTKASAGCQEHNQKQHQLHAPALLPGWNLPRSDPHPRQIAAGTSAPDFQAAGAFGAQPGVVSRADGVILHAAATGTQQNCGATPASYGGSIAAASGSRRSPFVMVDTWDLNPSSSSIAGRACSTTDAAPLQGYYWPAQPQQLEKQSGRRRCSRNSSKKVACAVRQQLAAAGDKPHSSKVKRELVKRLQAEVEHLTQVYQGDLALNVLLRQRWSRISQLYDDACAKQQQLQHQHQHPGQGAPGLAPPAAAAGSMLAPAAPGAQQQQAPAAGAGSSRTAAAAACYDDQSLDALAALVHTNWTHLLLQLTDLMPELDTRQHGNSSSSTLLQQQPPLQQQQQRLNQLEPPASAAPASAAAATATADVKSMFDRDISPFAAVAGAALSAIDSQGLQADMGPAAPSELAAVQDLLQGIPTECFMDDMPSMLPGFEPQTCDTGVAGPSHAKRLRSIRSDGGINADQLSWLLSSSLSLKANPPKQQRLNPDPEPEPRLNPDSGNLSSLTSAELHLLFSSSIPQHKECSLLHNQQQQLLHLPNKQAGVQQQQQQGGSVQGPSVVSTHQGPLQQQEQQQDATAATGTVAASDGLSPAAAALNSAASVYSSCWGLFEQVGQAGPSLLYRCFGPQNTTCPCCCPSTRGVDPLMDNSCPAPGLPTGGCSAAGAAAARKPDRAPLLAMLSSEASAAMGSAAGAASTAAAAAAAGGGGGGGNAVSTDGASPLVPVFMRVTGSAQHWQRAASSIVLTPDQQASMQALWAGVHRAHETCVSKRQQLLAALQQQFGVGGGCPFAAHRTCQGGNAAADAADQLLEGIENSMAADFGVLLETCKCFWGDESPLTLPQKAKLLVASYPYWPDYNLLAYLAGYHPAAPPAWAQQV